MSQSICTVVIPAFNAEKTIQTALDSIVEKGRSQYPIDIIVIDDGSCDSTFQIVSEYMTEHHEVTCYQKPNGGVSSARNLGLRYVQTKYVFFLDADDLLLRDGLEQLIDTAEKTAADLIVAPYYLQKASGKTETPVDLTFPKNTVLREDYIRQNILRRFFVGQDKGLPNLWNKLYSVDIIRSNRLDFDEKKTHGEDWHFNIRYLQCASSVVVTDTPTLIYQTGDRPDYAKYKKALAYSLIDQFRIGKQLNQTYHYCSEDDTDYMLFVRRAAGKALAYLSLKECPKDEKIRFLDSDEEKYIFTYLSKLDREKLRFLDYSKKDRLAFWLIKNKMFESGIKILNK